MTFRTFRFQHLNNKNILSDLLYIKYFILYLVKLHIKFLIKKKRNFTKI